MSELRPRTGKLFETGVERCFMFASTMVSAMC
jgi:hypothetical protein